MYIIIYIIYNIYNIHRIFVKSLLRRLVALKHCVSHQPGCGIDSEESLTVPHPMQHGPVHHHAPLLECPTDWVQLVTAEKLEDLSSYMKVFDLLKIFVETG